MGTETTVLCISFSRVLEGFWETEEDAKRHQNIGRARENALHWETQRDQPDLKKRRQRTNLQVL